MTNQPHASTFIEPEAAAPAATVAAEFFVHGLLSTVFANEQLAAESRIGRVLAAIDAQAREARSSPFKLPRFARWAIAATLLIAAGAALFLTGPLGGTSAQAKVMLAIDAMCAPGDRRYEVSVLDWSANATDPHPDLIDTRTPGGLILIRHMPPWETSPITVGRDEKGSWSIQPDGSVDRTRPQRDWPPWTSLDGESLFADSVDHLLEALPRTYELKRGPSERADSDNARLFDRISASRINKSGPRPHHVELWIDPETRIVERIEFHWDPAGQDLGKSGGNLATKTGPGPPPRDTDRQPTPDGLGGPSDRAGRRRPPPPPGSPKALIFQRVDIPTLPPDWFTPAGHANP